MARRAAKLAMSLTFSFVLGRAVAEPPRGSVAVPPASPAAEGSGTREDQAPEQPPDPAPAPGDGGEEGGPDNSTAPAEGDEGEELQA